MPLAGPVIMKFDSAAPVTMSGVWSMSVAVPVARHFGQGEIGKDGNVKPGSGYIGSAPGTSINVRGQFEFAIDSTGELVKQTVLRGLYKTFTAVWPIGDMASGEVKASAKDCKFDELSFEHNGPEGKYTIRGTMTAGTVTGLEPDDL